MKLRQKKFMSFIDWWVASSTFAIQWPFVNISGNLLLCWIFTFLLPLLKSKYLNPFEMWSFFPAFMTSSQKSASNICMLLVIDKLSLSLSVIEQYFMVELSILCNVNGFCGLTQWVITSKSFAKSKRNILRLQFLAQFGGGICLHFQNSFKRRKVVKKGDAKTHPKFQIVQGELKILSSNLPKVLFPNSSWFF